MNTLELKLNQKVGVIIYNDNRGTKAKIEEVIRISPTGYITLKNGKRYNPKGIQVGVDRLIATHLCSVERVQEIMQKAEAQKKQREAERQAYLASPEGILATTVEETVKAVIQILNQHGWYADVDGHMDVMESEIKKIVERYVSEHKPIS